MKLVLSLHVRLLISLLRHLLLFARLISIAIHFLHPHIILRFTAADCGASTLQCIVHATGMYQSTYILYVRMYCMYEASKTSFIAVVNVVITRSSLLCGH